MCARSSFVLRAPSVRVGRFRKVILSATSGEVVRERGERAVAAVAVEAVEVGVRVEVIVSAPAPGV